ncbi:zinc finger BED domain-containing protein RICESLEEPER [Trifolium repens]|nr:zinc finger BED domain-containing protein RICESLEEPER [Trifolium repens]
MWRSSHQVVEYMVITGHFIDVGWNLNKRVLSFVKVPAPRRGIDVADAIYKCLKTWVIENKVFSVSVDNASYNDSCLRSLKDNLSLTCKLIHGGSLFHVRCCAHILNLLVQDGLSKIKDIIFNIRESVKYINHNDGRLKAFCDVVEQKGLKERKLIIDCPTRWNSTFNMLSTALKFKIAFASYKEREPHYDFFPSLEEWNKVEKVCKLLEVFNCATHVISEVADENIKKVRSALDDLYDEYVALSLVEASSSDGNFNSNNQSSSQANVAAVKTGFDEIMCIIQENEAIGPMKSELQEYLDDGLYTPPIPTSFSALDWWRNNSMKYKILSKMAADILAIPISKCASESRFSAGGRVIDEFRSRLSEDSVEALICGGDWFRHKYNVTKNSKENEHGEQIEWISVLFVGVNPFGFILCIR